MGTYLDTTGARYRPTGRCPWSELTPGTPYALPGDPKVYTRRDVPPGSGGDPLARGIIDRVRNGTTVVVLERMHDAVQES